MGYDSEKVIDFYYDEYKNGLLGKKYKFKLFVYPSYIEGNALDLCEGVVGSNTISFNIQNSDITNVYESTYDNKKVLLVEYKYSSIVGNASKTLLFFGIEDTQKWVTTIDDAKSNYLQLLSKKEQQEAEREEYQKKLAIEKEKNALDFYQSCYSFHIKENTPTYKLFEETNKTALIYIGEDKSINFLKIDGYAKEESTGIIEYDKIHYYEKVGNVHYTTQIHGTYSNYGGGFTGANFSKLLTAGGGLLFGMMGMAAGALLSYKPAKQEPVNTSFEIDSDVNKIDDRNILLNFYSDSKKQYIDISLPNDIYNFLQTYLPEKKYSIVEELEKKAVVYNSASSSESKHLIDTSSENCLPESNEQMSDFKQKIDKLILLHDSGILSDEEFEEQKQRILETL